MRFFTSTGPSRSGVHRYREAIPRTTVLPALDLAHVRDRARQRRCDHGRSLGYRARARRTIHRRRHARRAGRHRRTEAARCRGPAHRGRRRRRHDDLRHHVGGRGRRTRRLHARPVRRRARAVQQRRDPRPRRRVARSDGTVGAGDRRQPVRRDPRHPRVPADHGAAGSRPHRQHRVDGRPHRACPARRRTP